MLNFQTIYFRPFRKWVASLVMAPFAFYFATHRGIFTLLDTADLIIHEAGHFVFMFFGEFIQFAGGTLWQIIFPAGLALYFMRHDYRTGFQLMTFWLGHNLVNISVYAADAEVQQLPLVGGGIHDWHFMLSRLNALDSCYTIGTLFFVSSVLVMGMSVLIPLVWEEWKGSLN